MRNEQCQKVNISEVLHLYRCSTHTPAPVSGSEYSFSPGAMLNRRGSLSHIGKGEMIPQDCVRRDVVLRLR